MFNIYQQVLYRDKEFTNPILGEVKCSALCSKLSECEKGINVMKAYHYQCFQLQLACKKCFSCNDKEQFNEWTLKQYEQSLNLIKYLRERNSQIPDQMLKNSWAVFSNPENLIKYKQHLKQQKQQQRLAQMKKLEQNKIPKQ